MSQSAKSSGAGSMKKTLSLWNYFTIGFGAIIGTGWVLLVGNWMILGGGPAAAVIAFAAGAVCLLPIGAVFGELTAAIPVSGGVVEYVDRAFGPGASQVTGWLLALGNGILCPWETIAVSTLIAEMFGGLFPVLRSIRLYAVLGTNVYLFPTLISLGCAAYVVFLNFRGASSAAKLQGFLTKALLCGMLLAMCVSLFRGGPRNALPLFARVRSAAGATHAGSLFSGILSVLVMTPFFYAGFDTIPQQAEEAAEGMDWKKFGRIISLALLASAVFYVICIYAFGTILPWRKFTALPVPALACLKSISFPLYLVMLIIATLGPLGPMNSFFGASTRILLAMGRKGYLPAAFTEVDPKTGVPRNACILLAAITLAGPFLGAQMLVPLTNVSSLAFIFACTMVSFSCLRMRRTEPKLPRPYRVPGGRVGIGLACAAGTGILLLMAIPFSPAALTLVEWRIVVIWLGIGLVLHLIAKFGKARRTVKD